MKKQIIIIFEGHDKSGKTTISQVLSNKIQVPIFKMDRPKYFWDPVSYQTYATEAITQMIEKLDLSVILDRSFPSDYMYSKLFGRPYNFDSCFLTDLRFAAMAALIVYCYKDHDAYLDDPEDAAFIHQDDYDKMKAIYQQFLDKTKCRFIKINTSDENIEKQIEKIIKTL